MPRYLIILIREDLEAVPDNMMTNGVLDQLIHKRCEGMYNHILLPTSGKCVH